LEVAEDSRDLVRSGSFSHESLPGSLPVVRFPLRLDQVLGGRSHWLPCRWFFGGKEDERPWSDAAVTSRWTRPWVAWMRGAPAVGGAPGTQAWPLNQGEERGR